MVDIHEKGVQYREAVATGEIHLKPETVERIREGRIEKGDPIQIATLAGIQGAKLTPMLIPLCHPIQVESVDVKFDVEESTLKVTVRVSASAKTGVEMEALAAVTAALLNVWDVVKMYEKDKDGQYPTTSMSNVKVVRKVKS